MWGVTFIGGCPCGQHVCSDGTLFPSVCLLAGWLAGLPLHLTSPPAPQSERAPFAKCASSRRGQAQLPPLVCFLHHQRLFQTGLLHHNTISQTNFLLIRAALRAFLHHNQVYQAARPSASTAGKAVVHATYVRDAVRQAPWLRN